jgi:hypothetical protein
VTNVRRLSLRNSGAFARALFLCPAPIPTRRTLQFGVDVAGGMAGSAHRIRPALPMFTLAGLSLRALLLGFAILCALRGAVCSSADDFIPRGSAARLRFFTALRARQSHSLPSHGRSPSRSWLLVVLFIFSIFILYTRDLAPLWFSPMLGTHKPSILTPDPLRVQPAMTSQPSTQKSERALGQA